MNLRRTVCAVAVLGLVAPLAQACFMVSPQPMTVWLDHIEVDINHQVAVKTYNCTFKNPNPQAVVGGMCYMELEPGAQVDDMTVLVDGKEMKAEILDVEKAKEVFNDVVKNGGSPALLEYYGNQLIQTQIPRVAPNSTVTVKLTYTTVLKKRGDMVRLQMLNTNPKALMQPLKSASVKVNIKSSQPLKNIYSPTHKIKLVETPDADISVQWGKEDYMPKHPFVLYYQVAEEEVGASLLAHRELGEEGHFMLMLSPTLGTGADAVSQSDILPKDIVFCVDTSGSMLEGNKMEQARKALEYCINHLNPGDRFNIVDFSTAARSFHDGELVEANDENQQRALRYAGKMAPRGGTAIQEALEKSLELLGDDGRLKMILFATDGLPTIGERDPEAILRNMTKKNTEGVRIFVFGEGFDVNTKLLDFLALNHRGEADYILPEEDIAEKISNFFDRVGSPIMTDLSVEIDGLRTDDIYPPQIPDLYRGEQVILFGRYDGAGVKTVRLAGYFQGERREFEYDIEFPESTDDAASFVPRLWAGRKIDFLLSELRKSDKPDDELVDEVTYLAKRYGIVTPYTSFLMAEDIVTGKFGEQQQGQIILRRQLAANASGVAPAASGPGAPPADQAREKFVRDAKDEAAARATRGRSGAADALYEAAEAELRKQDGNRRGDGDGEKSSLAAIRYIGPKTFYREQQRWYDSTYEPEKHEKELKKIKVGSEQYFELLDENIDLAKYLALTDVVLKYNGQWYHFTP